MAKSPPRFSAPAPRKKKPTELVGRSKVGGKLLEVQTSGNFPEVFCQKNQGTSDMFLVNLHICNYIYAVCYFLSFPVFYQFMNLLTHRNGRPSILAFCHLQSSVNIFVLKKAGGTMAFGVSAWLMAALLYFWVWRVYMSVQCTAIFPLLPPKEKSPTFESDVGQLHRWKPMW